MTLRSLLVLVLAISLTACDATPSDRTPQLPATKSAFENWQGIRIVRGVRCPKCCTLVFPDRFGLDNPSELRVLQGIVNATDIKHDVDCVMPIAYDAMDHLKKLAIQNQDRDAAALILDPEGHGGLDFGGGELAELYGPQYLVPTLIGYDNLPEILDPNAEKRIAEHVCLASYDPATSEDFDLTLLLGKLREKKATSLVSEIAQACQKYEREVERWRKSQTEKE